MKIHVSSFLLLLFLLCCRPALAQNINNPVLPGIADAGVLKYNGKYYIGGVFTDGDFYVSEDLINWIGPVHVFDMNNQWTDGTGAGNNQIHANDMIYLNGMFHLYWSVNYWGKDRHVVHIAHSESDKVLGPYVEPVKETWMDNRIDPQIFQDDDGKLYMYMVRFTDGNTIWVRPMKDPRTFSGHPVCQFASLPNTWETMDNRVAEGPFVIKYRNRYYMMYNANHTGTAWGNYQLGVAEADSPTTFNNGNKYPYPLFLSNQTILEEKYADILRIGQTYDPAFRYTTETPSANWNEIQFNDAAWAKGEAGFASEEIKGSTVRYRGASWDTPEIYLRKTFWVDKSNTGNLALRVTHDGATRVYLNGKLIYNKEGSDYIICNLTEKDKEALKNGQNLLSVESRKGRRNYIDVSLFDTKDEKADDILFSPGQPNIVRGPNGFEWWLVYMANKNQERRSQYANRIYFHDKTMHADGITAAHTTGYFPEPTKPTVSRLEEYTLTSHQEWMAAENNQPATTYLFEANVNTNANAGVFAWHKDKENWMKVGLDSSTRKWYISQSVNNRIQTDFYPLDSAFRFGVYHKITVERNVRNFSIRIDGLPAPGMPVLQTAIDRPGIPGVFAENGDASFAGVICTNGWDESDHEITGWSHSLPGTRNLTAFKGDLLSKYEFSVQITNASGTGKAGAYPVYIDNRNYIQTLFDAGKQTLTVISVRDGKTVSSNDYPLNNRKTHYADIKYTDFIEKGYTFHTPTWITGIHLNRLAFGERNVFVENMFEKLTVEYCSGGKWYPVPVNRTKVADNPMYNEAVFGHPVKADALRFTNKDPQDEKHYIYKIKIDEVFKQSNNLRCVKLDNLLLIFVDNRQIVALDAPNTPARVGLCTENTEADFNGIQRYHIP